MNHTTDTNSNHARAEFCTNRIDLSAELPDHHVTATITMGHAPHYVEQLRREHKLPRSLPEFFLGSFVAVARSGVCHHVGLISDVVEGGETRKFVVNVFPLTSMVELRWREVARSCNSTLFSRSQRPSEYSAKFSLGTQVFESKVTPLQQVDADHLRGQIGPFVPEAIRQIFWSEGEIAQLEANAIAQERYVQLAQELINCQGA